MDVQAIFGLKVAPAACAVRQKPGFRGSGSLNGLLHAAIAIGRTQDLDCVSGVEVPGSNNGLAEVAKRMLAHASRIDR